ncbi:MAG: hypothetical protein CMF41_02105 [Legionellales bacterium]|nr:hypothetical protein [Legionellales bacterium]|tara:strand:- start:1781 stop:2131 length:351 start_codon:yes stop_codon:yes gene_type:complete
MSKILYYIAIFLSPVISAVQPHPAELGDYVAQVAVTQSGPNPTKSLSDINDFIHLGGTFMVNLLFISGIALLLGAVTQYVEHRKNPMNPPLSKVVTLLVLGVCLVAASFIPFPTVE